MRLNGERERGEGDREWHEGWEKPTNRRKSVARMSESARTHTAQTDTNRIESGTHNAITTNRRYAIKHYMIGREEKMVSFWRGNYIFINRGPVAVDVVLVVVIVVVIDVDANVDATHDVHLSSLCELNRQRDRQTHER